MTESEKIKNIENWKTTKEVAKALKVSPITLRVYKNQNKEQFEGLITRSVIEREGKVREHLLWSHETILQIKTHDRRREVWIYDSLISWPYANLIISLMASVLFFKLYFSFIASNISFVSALKSSLSLITFSDIICIKTLFFYYSYWYIHILLYFVIFYYKNSQYLNKPISINIIESEKS